METNTGRQTGRQTVRGSHLYPVAFLMPLAVSLMLLGRPGTPLKSIGISPKAVMLGKHLPSTGKRPKRQELDDGEAELVLVQCVHFSCANVNANVFYPICDRRHEQNSIEPQ